MSERVVHVLEVVDVEKQKRDDHLLFFGACESFLHRVVQKGAVGQAGERIVARKMHQLPMRFSALGDVFDKLGNPRSLSRWIGTENIRA